ncbi:hypothetical protein P692DRAFT_20830983 [Suillus brevipes Sb2]|nr:hypothetical protein P692DRAFT_20830983 [Suillus brevipes Sb2]
MERIDLCAGSDEKLGQWIRTQSFFNIGLPEFQSRLGSHPAILEHMACGTRASTLKRKIHHPSFASLGFTHVGHDLPYSEVASTLQFEFRSGPLMACPLDILSFIIIFE